MNLNYSLLCLLVLSASSPTWSATYTVVSRFDDNQAHDANPGDGICADDLGVCTLRAAIEEANTDNTFDIILFDDTLAGLQINLAASEGPLPVISNGLAILANLMTDYNQSATLLRNAPPQITLSGENLSGINNNGLLFSSSSASGSIVSGMSIVSFTGHGIQAAFGADDLDIDRNYIGALPDFSQAGNGSHGIYLQGGADNRIGKVRLMDGSGFSGLGNVISSNGQSGVRIESSNNNSVLANLIGIRPSGTNARGNGEYGINLSGSGNQVGDVAESESAGNFIAGNGLGSIAVFGSNNVLLDNTLGLGETGSVLDSAGHGILIRGNNNQVGLGEGTGNRIYEHQGSAIRVGDESVAAVTGNLISRNIIGRLGAFGLAASGNGSGIHVALGNDNQITGNTIINSMGGTDLDPDGMFVRGDSNQVNANQLGFVNTIGGPIIQANGIGIYMIGDGNTVSSNVVGGNEDEGMYLEGSGYRVFDNLIGVTAQYDLIGNQDHGMVLANGINHEIFGNVIGDNLFTGLLTGAVRSSLIDFNFIGISPTGVPIGNDRGMLIGLAEDLTVDNNYIAHNRRTAIEVNADSDTVRMTSNRIHDNVQIGIDLNRDMATANDPGDPDEQGNRSQNYPLIESAQLDSTRGVHQLTVHYRVDTNADNASYPLAIEFFWTPFDEPAQGRFVLETDSDYTTPNALKMISIDFPSSLGGGWLTATATDQDGNTSEMSERQMFGTPGFIFQDGFE